MKVSVVVTILNEEDNIEHLIQSLFSQTQKPDEIIIVDGGSTDTTVSKITNYKLKIKNSSFNVFTKKGNRAVGRNFGISKAKNEIIAVTDAGGYPKEDWLEKICVPFKNKSVQIVSGYYEAKTESVFEKCVAPYFLVMPDKAKKKKEFLSSSRSVAFRKSIWEKTKYPEQYSHNEDLVWDYELKKSGLVFEFTPNAIVYWYPPRNIFQAVKTFYRFSLGDAEANIPRLSVHFIYYRYLGALLILGMGKLAFGLIPLFFVYCLWSILKNYKYVKYPQAFFWLPLIQIISDITIMWGHMVGKNSKC